MEISDGFQKIRDQLQKAGKTEEAIKAQWEMDFFNFIIDSNVLIPKFTMTNEKGEEIGYPTMSRFTDKTYEYLIYRLDSTNNPLLKARYAHILWLSPKKHGRFAQIAIDSYLKLVKICEEKAKKIAGFSSEDILKFLIMEPSLLPKYADIEKLACEISKGHLASVIPHTVIDERGHVEQHFSTEAELKLFQTLQQYDLALQAQYMQFINIIIIEAVKANKLNFSSVIQFFKKYAWFGKTLSRKNQNQDIPYNWLNLLAPALREYFAQLNYLLESGNRPNFVLALDSLSLKIEGLLRDLCNFAGVTTFTQKMDYKERVIYHEKDLTALLHDEKLGKLMSADDLFLLKFVLVEKAGYNLRHRTAHSLLFFEEYSMFYMNLLFMILLKISKFEIKPNEKQNQAKEFAPA